MYFVKHVCKLVSLKTKKARTIERHINTKERQSAQTDVKLARNDIFKQLGCKNILTKQNVLQTLVKNVFKRVTYKNEYKNIFIKYHRICSFFNKHY